MSKEFIHKIHRLVKSRYFWFLFVSSLYAILVLWIGFYWLFAGILILADFYFTKFVNWRFWCKRLPKGQKHRFSTELIDSVIIAALFAVFLRIFFFEVYSIPTSSMERTLLTGDYILVNKLWYGPRMPMTPLTLPFTHSTLPFTKGRKSYNTMVQWPYKRLKGVSKIKHFDVVVFNYPEGDTVIRQKPEQSYYSIIRQYGRNSIVDKQKLASRPIDKCDNYVKRVIGLPGDTIKIQHGYAYINNKVEVQPEGLQLNYSVKILNASDTLYFNQLNISEYDIQTNEYNSIYTVPLTSKAYHYLIDSGNFKALTKYENIDPTETNRQIFPFDKQFSWTEDNYGSVVVPKSGTRIEINLRNLPLYKRIIAVYEGNKLEVKDDKICINDTLRNSYTFKMNYYFMMGDNRHNSNDSRFWGFVPEDHIIGKARLVWLSIDKNKKFPNNIRWNKMFKFIR
jgi:signal peptidase I